MKKSFEMLEIWTSRGKIWPLCTLWRSLHMFLDILVFRIENQKNCLEKTVLKMWSQKFQIWASFVPKICQKLGMFLRFFLKVVLRTHSLFFHKSETTFSKQFSLNNLLFSSILNSKMSKKNMCEWRHKVLNGQILPQ